MIHSSKKIFWEIRVSVSAWALQIGSHLLNWCMYYIAPFSNNQLGDVPAHHSQKDMKGTATSF